MQMSVGLLTALFLLSGFVPLAYAEAGEFDLSDPAGSWHVGSYLNLTGIMVAPVAGTEITAIFGPDMTLSGTGGCNFYSTEYTIGSGAMLISPVTMINQVCAEDLNAQERAFFDDLKGVARAEKNETTLHLFDDDDQMLIKLLRVQEKKGQ